MPEADVSGSRRIPGVNYKARVVTAGHSYGFDMVEMSHNAEAVGTAEGVADMAEDFDMFEALHMAVEKRTIELVGIQVECNFDIQAGHSSVAA